MKFGKSSAEYEKEPKGSDGSAFIKYLRKGDNELQILDEYDDWVWYWEHFNPGGYSFPCMEDDRANCPGCQSSNEKMKKATRRASFNALAPSKEGDKRYVNVWKVPKTVGEKLKNRYDRQGTITDRPYVITQLKNAEDRYDYDIEGQEKREINWDEVRPNMRNPSELLEEAWNEAWGDSSKAAATQAKVETATQDAETRMKIDKAVAEREAAQSDDPPPWAAAPKEEPPAPAEDKVYTEQELRAMSPTDLIALCKKEGLGTVPSEFTASSDLIVGWMLDAVS